MYASACARVCGWWSERFILRSLEELGIVGEVGWGRFKSECQTRGGERSGGKGWVFFGPVPLQLFLFLFCIKPR